MSILNKLVLLSLLSSCCTFSQNNTNLIDSSGLKQGLWEEVLDSTSHDKRQILYLEKANYLNDTLHGNYLLLENEVISYEAEYFKGSMIGYERFYDGNGRLKRIVHRQNGIDFELKFYSNGYPKDESYFIAGNISSSRNYYSNGRVRLISYYVNNELNDKQYYYKKNGTLRMIMEYKNGKVISVSK